MSLYQAIGETRRWIASHGPAMIFHDKYELLAIRNGGREIAMAGREILSGRPVVVHLLGDQQTAGVRRLLDRLKGLRTKERRHVVDIGDHEGIAYVVTAGLPGQLGVKRWIDGVQPLAHADASVATPTAQPGEVVQSMVRAPLDSGSEQERPAPGSSQPGEFTRLFIKPQGNAQLSLHDRTPIFSPSPSSLAPAPRLPDKPAEAGEFTRLFGSPSDSEAGSVKEPEISARSQTVRAGPGDFTRMLQSPLAAANALPAHTAEPVRPASEFTRIMLANELPQMPGDTRESRAGRQFSARPAFAVGGEMTRMFESPLVETGDSIPQSALPCAGVATGAVAVAAQQAAREPGEFTRIFAAPSDSGRAQTVAPSAEPTKGSAQPAALRQQPRAQMARPAAASVMQPYLAAQSKLDRARREKSNLPFVVILGGLLLLFVILVLVFVMIR
jgi:hypothetical protein